MHRGQEPGLGNPADVWKQALGAPALADACSRDDGTGYWPSAATITRKASISDRTVRKVIVRQEAYGHALMHRSGGRLLTGPEPASPASSNNTRRCRAEQKVAPEAHIHAPRPSSCTSQSRPNRRLFARLDDQRFGQCFNR
jgi:hypothetical protein